MFLSKIYFILIALVAGLAVTMALVAPRPAVQKLEQLEGQRLDRAQYAAEQMLKVDAHKWIDRVSKLGRDAILSEALDSASHGKGELGILHKTVQDRVRGLIPDLASGGIDTLVAVDVRGRVIARLGEGEAEYGDYVGGAEIVMDALRGYLSDDVWGARGKLMRVAGGPVLSKSRDRIVGAIYVGAETGTGLVERLKRNLDVDIALLLRGKLVASSKYTAELEPLPGLIDEHRKEIDEVKRTPAIPIPSGSDRLLAVAAPFPGQASQQQAYYVLIGRRPAKADLASLLSNTTSDDLKWGHFPWLPLAGTVAGVILLGLAMQRWEVDRPIRRLRREVQRIAKGDGQKVDDHKFGGKFGGLARDVNAAIERFSLAPGAGSDIAGKDLGSILAGANGQTFDLPAPDSAFSGNTPPPAFAPPPAPAFVPPPPPSFAPPPPPPPAFAPPAPFASHPGSAMPGMSPAPITTGAPTDNEATRVVPMQDDNDEEAHYRRVYDEFVATKQQCGESLAGLTLEKFRAKLRDNKSALMSKHTCRTVRFSVYIKDGKAALKATPVRD